MCAEMTADLEPCYAMVWHAAHCIDEDEEDSRFMSCHSKAHTSEVGKAIAKKLRKSMVEWDLLIYLGFIIGSRELVLIDNFLVLQRLSEKKQLKSKNLFKIEKNN